MTEEKKFFCTTPFTNVELRTSGDVFLCCAGWTNYSLGNWMKNSFEDIWNGERAREFRRTILDGSYRLCKLKRCLHYGNKNMFYSRQQIEEFKEVSPPPKTVDFGHEKVCNVRCVMCRDEHIHNDKVKTKELDGRIKGCFLPMVANAECVAINGDGEALASAHCRKLIKAIVEKYPAVKFTLRTNGVLADENNFKALGLIGRVKFVVISLHAVTKKTYDKIVLDSNFKRIMKNIEWLNSLKKQGEIGGGFGFISVISVFNYREMIPFIKFAQKYNTSATFLEYYGWEGTKMGQSYDKMAVFKEWHPAYNKYVRISNKIMNNNKLRSSVSVTSPLLFNLKPIGTRKWLKYRVKELELRMKELKGRKGFHLLYRILRKSWRLLGNRILEVL